MEPTKIIAFDILTGIDPTSRVDSLVFYVIENNGKPIRKQFFFNSGGYFRPENNIKTIDRLFRLDRYISEIEGLINNENNVSISKEIELQRSIVVRSDYELSDKIQSFLYDEINDFLGKVYYLHTFYSSKINNIKSIDNYNLAWFYTPMYYLRNLLVRNGRNYCIRFNKNVFSVHRSGFRESKNISEIIDKFNGVDISNFNINEIYSNKNGEVYQVVDKNKCVLLLYKLGDDNSNSLHYYPRKDPTFELKREENGFGADDVFFNFTHHFSKLKEIYDVNPEYNIYEIPLKSVTNQDYKYNTNLNILTSERQKLLKMSKLEDLSPSKIIENENVYNYYMKCDKLRDRICDINYNISDIYERVINNVKDHELATKFVDITKFRYNVRKNIENKTTYSKTLV